MATCPRRLVKATARPTRRAFPHKDERRDRAAEIELLPIPDARTLSTYRITGTVLYSMLLPFAWRAATVRGLVVTTA